MELLCPICGSVLKKEERAYRCGRGHSFDIARQGYVNLLPVQQKHSLHPGDTVQQVASRREFLSAGFYQPIADTLCREMKALSSRGPLLDLGCGEGYYSVQAADAVSAELVGLDISKEAVRLAAGKYKNARWICGTAAKVPVENHCAGAVMSLFALTVPEEFRRILKPDGLFFQILAAQDHLLNLKSIIYPELKLRPKDSVPELAGFSLVRSIPIRFSFTVRDAQVQNLLSMTPHVYRISQEGARRLAAVSVLTDTASCVLNIYRPAP